MICGYPDCQQEITDKNVSYKYFPEGKVYKPVHSYHLRTKRKESDNVKSQADSPQKVLPVREDDLK
jgi:hypothetical protein